MLANRPGVLGRGFRGMIGMVCVREWASFTAVEIYESH